MTGPNADPNAPHAFDTSAMIPSQSGFIAMASATTEMMMTTILPAQSISLSDALFLNIGLYTSDENADDEARSCESAVLMDAARIAERSIPATSAGNTPLTSLMNTCELSVSPPPRYLRPTIPTTDAITRMIPVQQVPTILDFFISFSDLIEMYLIRICGIPIYPSPHASPDMILITLVLSNEPLIRTL